MIEINGKQVTEEKLRRVLPLTMGDWRVLSRDHDLEPEEVASGDAKFYKMFALFAYVLRKAEPSLTDEDLDSMAEEDMRFVSDVLRRSREEEQVDRPT